MGLEIKKVAVLGAGVMGAGIAAHLANAGIPSLLFDLQRPDASIAALLKQKPAALFHSGLAALIEPCAFGADAARYAECDWIVEAVTERVDIKRKVFADVFAHAGPQAIVTSNTSGIPIAAITEGWSDDWKRRFFVTHFFNPVRYMKLLELVSGPATDPTVFAALSDFGERVLGKGIVVGKDTPNFVANRIGTYGMMTVLHRMGEAGLSVTAIDKIFGKPMGRPKSAVFRTADIVGLDTLCHVAANCFDNLGDDPRRAAFAMPAFVQAMVERKLLGDKTGGGFYRKERSGGGKEILALDPATLEYKSQEKVRFASLGAVKDIEDVGARIKTLLGVDDVAGRFAWSCTADVLLYSAELLGTIADDVHNIDAAMRWGFGWALGPFETWDAIGLQASVDRMRAEGRTIPAVVETAVRAGGWYDRQGGKTRYLDAVGSAERRPVPLPPGVVLLRDNRDQGRLVQSNDSGSIHDLGDGVLGLEFHSKMNALDQDNIALYGRALDLLDGPDWAALVVGNQGEHFCAGANIMLVLMASMNGAWDQIETLTRGLQDTLMRAKHHRKPVVTAPFGLTLGGGAEVAMQSAMTRASGELYMGLVEVGVGLLPAGGGCKEMLFRLSAAEGVDADPMAAVKRAFELIGMAKVSTSAEEAREMGFLRPADSVSMLGDRVVGDARELALGLARAGWKPPRRRTIRAAGRSGEAALAAALWNFRQGGQATEYDVVVGRKVAHVLVGGDVATGTEVSEQHLLDLEREGFLSLCGDARTHARIQSMLMDGKPLRN